MKGRRCLMMSSDRVVVLCDWKRWGAFIGCEFSLQLGRYARCPYQYDKVSQQMSLKPEVEYGLVCWIGEEGVQAKMVLNRQELQEAGEQHVNAQRLAMYASKFAWKPFTPSRYPHPLKPGTFLWSVTEVNKYALAKEGLLNWYHKKGVEGVLTWLQEYASPEAPPLSEMTLEYVLEQLEAHKLRPVDLRDKAGDQGRTLHKLAMFFLQNKPVDLTDAPQAHKDFAAKFALWCQKVKLEPLAVEQMVYEEAPNEIAGTLDCQAVVDRQWVEGEWERLNTAQEGTA